MDARRDAWLRKFATEPEPWSGPVHSASLLQGLRGRVVELGAGGGKVSGALPRDALALDWATLPEGRPGLWGDVERLPFGDATVDAVVAIHVLGHVRTEVALAEIRRVLRPGGTLVLEVFAAGDVREGKGTQVGPRTFERGGIVTRYFAPDELRALLAGFRGPVTQESRRFRWGERRVLRGRLEAAG